MMDFDFPYAIVNLAVFVTLIVHVGALMRSAKHDDKQGRESQVRRSARAMLWVTAMLTVGLVASLLTGTYHVIKVECKPWAPWQGCQPYE